MNAHNEERAVAERRKVWDLSNPLPTRDAIALRALVLHAQRRQPAGPRTQIWYEAEQQLLSRAETFVLKAWRSACFERPY